MGKDGQLEKYPGRNLLNYIDKLPNKNIFCLIVKVFFKKVVP
jgi:hypothetical protein